ncbi:LysE family translocator [Nesterenkonia populi]
MLTSVLAFTLVAAVVVLTPGADTILVLRTSIRSGARAGTVTALGVVCGPVIWGALAGLGVALIVAQSVVLYALIAAAGGAYLCCLAYHSIAPAIGTWRRISKGQSENPGKDDAHTEGGACFSRGLVTNLLNPQIGVFYLAILPSLFEAEEIELWLGATLGAIHGALGLAFLCLVAYFTSGASALLQRPKMTASAEILCGFLLLTFGIYALADGVGVAMTVVAMA